MSMSCLFSPDTLSVCCSQIPSVYVNFLRFLL
jgi:hypothetical protein